MLRAQLDVVGASGSGSTIQAFNEYRASEAGEPDESDLFLALETGGRAEPDGLGRSWNAEAAAYLRQR